MKEVTEFPYLGIMVCKDGSASEEIQIIEKGEWCFLQPFQGLEMQKLEFGAMRSGWPKTVQDRKELWLNVWTHVE